jgi:YVTN family beta-propeller protein
MIVFSSVHFHNYVAYTDSVEATINVGTNPHGIVFNPSNNKMYVVNRGVVGNCESIFAHPFTHSISIIDDTTVTDTIQGGGQFSEECPHHIAFNPANNRMYVTHSEEDTVSVIVGTTVEAVVSTDDGPIGIAFSPVNIRMYVANSMDDDVQVFSSGTTCCQQEIEFDDTSPNDLAFNPANNRMYVTNFEKDSVSAIDINGNFDTVAVGDRPGHIAFNPANNRMYVSNAGGNTISVMDGTTVIDTIRVGSIPGHIAFNEDNQKMYVANPLDDTVSVIDATGVVETIQVGDGPIGVAYNPVNKKIYVTNSNDGTVSVISSAADFDADGIPDSIELSGIRDANGNLVPNNIPLGFPMDPCRKTVAVEIDYMGEALDGSHTHFPLKNISPSGQPNPALQIVLDAFNNAPIDPVPNCPYSSLGFPNRDRGVNLVIDISNSLPHIDGGYFFENGKFDAAKRDNFNDARKPYFHYMIWQHTGDRGEMGGNDFYVSDLKPFADNINDPDPVDIASVFMQELGHNLGLSHGGRADMENENGKPNYLSVMNYGYSYYLAKQKTDGTRPKIADYSREALPTLNEQRLLESAGVGDQNFVIVWNGGQGLGDRALDWNSNGIIDDQPPQGVPGRTVIADLNGDNSFTDLRGFDDWHNLDYIFQDSGDFADGIHREVSPPHPPDLAEKSAEVQRQIEIPPSITAPSDIVVLANTRDGATGVDLGIPVVSDNDDPNPVVTNDAPAVFPVGTTTVTWTAKDFFANSATDTQLVRVKAPPDCNNPTIVGNDARNDVLQGTPGNDVIDGLGGNDVINGNGGNDEICGRDGNDVINSGAGDDRIGGGAGNDRINSGAGDDELYGIEGNDVINSGAGDDLIDGGPDRDIGVAGPGLDKCFNLETASGCEP